jgi:hypothetical protein
MACRIPALVLLRLALLAVVPLAFTGCGNSTVDEPGTAVTGFFAALARDESKKACELLTGEMIRSITSLIGGSTTCEDAMHTLHGRLSEDEKQSFQHLKVKHVEVQGDRATINDEDVTTESGDDISGENDPTDIELRRIEGAWRISDLDA